MLCANNKYSYRSSRIAGLVRVSADRIYDKHRFSYCGSVNVLKDPSV